MKASTKPKRDTSNHTPRRTFRIPDELYRKAQAEAEERGEDLTKAVIAFMKRYTR